MPRSTEEERVFSSPPDHLATWYKSSRSGATGACVEVRLAGETVLVRDSKDPGGSVLPFAAPVWADFIAATKAGAFDRPRG